MKMLKALPLFFLCCLPLSYGQSVYNVQHNGVSAFSAPNLKVSPGGIYNFCDAQPQCENTPPPPIDPGAYTMLAVSWLGDAPTPHTIDVTRCENLWGRMTFAQTPILGWPYRTPTVRWNKTDNRYLRCRITMPANPGTLSHSFKTVNYSSLIPVKMALVSPGAPWPTGSRTACFIPLTVNDQPALYVNPGAPNTSKCSLGANQQADLLIDSANGQRGQIGVANY